MDSSKIIGSNIRFERQKRDLTIEELSEILKIAPGFLGLIERGKRGASLKNLCKIADFFSITLDDLIKRQMSEETEVRETPVLEQKRKTILSFINTMDYNELDYLIAIVKAFKRYNNSKYIEINSDFEDNIENDYYEEDFN